MLFGAVLMLLLGGLPSRWFGPDGSIEQLMGGGPLLIFAPMIILTFITRPPKVEPDWAAMAARHVGLARGLVVGGYCVGMLGAIALLGMGLASYGSSVLASSPLFWVPFCGMLTGFLLMALGESIKRAARKGEVGGRSTC